MSKVVQFLNQIIDKQKIISFILNTPYKTKKIDKVFIKQSKCLKKR